MIESTKSQNIIVLSTIIIGLISGAYLTSSTSYYSGSYAIARYMTVSLEDVQIANLDPSNDSINPSLLMVFNLKAPELTTGQVTLTYLSAVVHLDQDLIMYETFQKYVQPPEIVTAGYNKNFTLGSTVFELYDKHILYNASLSGNWTFNITFNLNYFIFQNGMLSRRVLFFVYDGYSPI